MAADCQQTATAGNPKGRQAVILIHGIGEQRPMETLRGFVDAFLDRDSYHSKPDTISDSYELRRIKLRWVKASATEAGVNPDWPDTDFYEYYWAHHMYGTRITHVTNWIARTMIGGARAARSGDLNRDIYHPRLRWMIPLSWTIAAVALVAILWFAVQDPFRATRAGAVVVAMGVLWKLIAPLLGTVFTDVLGDAARYLDVSPPNVARRYDIIRGGVDMLRKLHTQSDADQGRVVYRYSRIVVIGHSLGSVIAYEVLKHFWAEVNGKIRVDPADFADVESFDGGNAMPDGVSIVTYPDPHRYRDAQGRCWRTINRWWLARPNVSKEETEQPGLARWLVSDLVTLGCPLTYGPLLLADSAADFARKKTLRELPTCPPDRSQHVNKGRFTVSLAEEDDRITAYPILGHQAMFAVTRWTNFFFSNDPIGGRLDKLFLTGIEDNDLGSAGTQWTPLHAHVSYWKPHAVSAAKPCVDRMRVILKNVSLKGVVRMSTNADLARRWFKEVWVSGGERTVNELMAKDIVGYMEGADIHGLDEFLAQRTLLLQTFPDLAIVAEDVIEQGAKVAVRWHVNATHKGDGLGIPATNRQVSFRGITWLEFSEGRIVLGWDSWNLGALLQSLRLDRS